jgi:prophage antirepressor-like protein
MGWSFRAASQRRKPSVIGSLARCCPPSAKTAYPLSGPPPLRPAPAPAPSLPPVAQPVGTPEFAFKGKKVRVVELEGAPWFVAVDLYLILYGKTTGITATASIQPDEKQVIKKVSVPETLRSLFTQGQSRLALLTESGLYKLVMRSDMPEAKGFQDWVTREVLPTIRKTGAYGVAPVQSVTGGMDLQGLWRRSEVGRNGW